MDNGNTSGVPDSIIHALEAQAEKTRRTIITMIHTAQSGHPGGSLSATDIVTILYFHFMKIDPNNPDWPDRDRFVLSKGHACPVWYATLAHKGFFPMAEINTLRKFESRLQGHPVRGKLPGIDATTGSLGVGFSTSVGIALEARLSKKDYRVYALLGDGELAEGIVWEAAAAAAQHKLDNLIAIVDRNRLQNDGYTESIVSMEPVGEKFRAFNWKVFETDGHSIRDLAACITEALKVKNQPVCIIANTVKGKGVSFMEDVRGWHGKVPDDAQYAQAMDELGENR